MIHSFFSKSLPGSVPRWAWALLAVLALCGLGSTGRGVWNALQDDRSDDFQWEPAHRLISGENPYREYLTNPDRERVVSAEENNALPDYPITSYFFLSPYAVMNWPGAKLAWAITNLLCLGGIIAALWRLAAPRNPELFYWTLLAGALLSFSTPARDQIAAGQHTLFSLCAFLWAWILGRDESNSVAGRWLAPVLLAASWLKFTVTAPLTIAFLIHRRWREPVLAFGCHFVLLAAASLWTRSSPVTLVHDYVEATRAILFTEGIHSDVWDAMAVAEALRPGAGWLRALLSLIVMGAAGWVAHRRYRAGRTDDLETFAVLAVAACTAGFHLRYDFVVLSLTLVWLFTRSVEPAVRGAMLTAIVANWWGARFFERTFYHEIDPIHGWWEMPGMIGMAAIASGTWLVFAWFLARLAVTADAKPSRVLHHGVPLPHHGKWAVPASSPNPVGSRN
ncbi:MAG: DUF2029 domain-containing protein [Verrucomicrobiae bacterium]|nr:DUF2029 domain-containing protein [Verrucomicrobiae bacterium]